MVPSVSICVPIYNGEPYLEACLQSIAAQTFRDFEVILVDDCSTDGSLDIAKRWAASDPRFRVQVNEANRGLVGNWNRSIELAEGVWIKFLFQDDLMRPECLAEMLSIADSSGGFIACRRTVLYTGPVAQAERDWYARHALDLEPIYRGRGRLTAEQYAEAKLRNLNINIVGEPTVTLIRRDLFGEYGLFDRNMVQVCDSEMWNRLGSNVGIDYIDRELVTFRVHGGSTSAANDGRRFRGWVLDKIMEISHLKYGARYHQLRQVARRQRLWQTLRTDLQGRIFEAFEELRKADLAKPGRKPEREQLVAVLDRFGSYRRERLRYLLWRMQWRVRSLHRKTIGSVTP